MPSRRTHAAALITSLGLALTACPATDPSVPPGPSHAPAPPVFSPEPTPEGRLPSDVVPLSYALELSIDPARDRFSGAARIKVRTSAPRRSLFLHARDLRVEGVLVDAQSGAKISAVATALAEELLRVDVSPELPPGEHTLTFKYDAPFADGLAGLYRVQTPSGPYAFTQFEAVDARRAFPCFDEPSFKTPFEVTLDVPKGQVAISNAPAVKSAPEGELTRVTFARTEPLPTYLLAFAVGPFDVVEAAPVAASPVRKQPLPLRGVALKGKGPQLKAALEEHAKLVLELERYFEIPYPYAKLDVIAVPDFSAGAMENAGAITYRESLLLMDPATVSESQRRDVVETAAHELAHQWFGNLVTMHWWDDLWLNEAFATWMGERVVTKLYPQWKLDVELLKWVHEAMDTDSLLSARKIRQAIVSKDDIDNAFDDLTYSKGAGIISMFERYLGPETFRAGVRRYLEQHRFGSATTEDFMSALMQGQPATLTVSFKQLLERPGVPRVAVSTRCAGPKLAGVDVSMERYLPLGSKGDAKLPFTLPLCVSLDGKAVCDVVSTEPGKSATLALPAQAACPKTVFANSDGAGYLRVAPDAAQAGALFGPSFAALSERERLAAADALAAAFRAGTVDAAATFGGLRALAKDSSRHIAFAGVPLLDFISDQLVASADRPAFSKQVSAMFSARFKALGWLPKPGEEADAKLARREAVEAMLFLARDPEARAEALKRARAVAGVGQAPDREAAPPELFAAVLRVGVEDGGAALFDALLERLAKSDESVYRRGVLLALAHARSDELAKRARVLVLDERVRASERLRLLFELSWVPEQRAALLAWLEAELPALLKGLPENTRGYLPAIAESQCDAALEPKLRALFEPHLKAMTGGPRTLENALEKLRICDAIKKHHAPGLAKVLAGR